MLKIWWDLKKNSSKKSPPPPPLLSPRTNETGKKINIFFTTEKPYESIYELIPPLIQKAKKQGGFAMYQDFFIHGNSYELILVSADGSYLRKGWRCGGSSSGSTYVSVNSEKLIESQFQQHVDKMTCEDEIRNILDKHPDLFPVHTTINMHTIFEINNLLGAKFNVTKSGNLLRDYVDCRIYQYLIREKN